MEQFERIYIQRIRIDGTPFYKRPRPIPAAEIIQTFAEHGLTFKEAERFEVMLDQPYAQNRLEQVKSILKLKKWDLDVRHRAHTVYDDNDFDQAPFLRVYFRDYYDATDFSWICDTCGKKHKKIDTSVRGPEVKSRKPFLSVSARFNIVAAEVVPLISAALTGARFAPYDEAERYFYFDSTCDLGMLLMGDDTTTGFTGEYCSQCKHPKFTMHFGIDRYDKARWSGEDIVKESFFGSLLFTPKAFKLFHSLDRGLERAQPVWLV